VSLYLSTFTHAVIVVFVMADAIGNAAVILSLTKGMDDRQRSQTINKASIVATIVLVAFAFVGQSILNYLHITLSSFRVAGGLLLLLTALDMLQGGLHTPAVEADRDIAITPLALPLLAGPGTLTTVMVLVSESPKALLSVIAGILAAMLVSWVVMLQSKWVNKWIGLQGELIIVKLMGFLLAAFAVEMGSTGLKELFLSPLLP
jgi:multiple antibiotic resistance protein